MFHRPRNQLTTLGVTQQHAATIGLVEDPKQRVQHRGQHRLDIDRTGQRTTDLQHPLQLLLGPHTQSTESGAGVDRRHDRRLVAIQRYADHRGSQIVRRRGRHLAVLETHQNRSELDAVLARQQRRRLDRLAVDRCAVATAQILDRVPTFLEEHPGVSSRHRVEFQLDSTVGMTTNQNVVTVQIVRERLPSLKQHQHRHCRPTPLECSYSNLLPKRPVQDSPPKIVSTLPRNTCLPSSNARLSLQP